MQDSSWALTRAEWRGRIDLLPRPAGHAPLDAARTLLVSGPAHSEVFHHPQALLPGLLSITTLPSLWVCLALSQPKSRTLHLALLNSMKFTVSHLSSLFRSLWIHPFPPVWDYNTQLGVISTFAEGVLDPTILVTNKDVGLSSWMSAVRGCEQLSAGQKINSIPSN